MKKFAIIMAGGTGKRLWPLSREKMPKQFLDLFGEGSLLKNTIRRLEGIIDPGNIIIVAAENQREVLLKDIGDLFPPENILFEPMARNTSACITLAAKYIEELAGGDPDAVMCVFPSDHHIADIEEFRSVLSKGLDAANNTDYIVTVGVTPTYAATGFGYIQFGESIKEIQGAYLVERFVEKPSEKHALRYLQEGKYFWNGGIFIAKAGVLLDSVAEFLPDLYEGVFRAYTAMRSGQQVVANVEYAAVQSIAIDFGVMEKSKKIIVFPGDFGWNDVGSFDSIHDLAPKDKQGNAILTGHFLAFNSQNFTLYSKKKLVALIGVEDLVVIDTEDVLYLCKTEQTQDTKEIVDMLPTVGLNELG